MDSASTQVSKVYTPKTAQFAARSKPVTSGATMSDQQRAALEKVLQDTKPSEYVKKVETDGSGRYEQQQAFVQQQQEWLQKHMYNPEKKKTRSAQRVIIAILLFIIMSGVGFFGWYYWWTTYASFEYNLHTIVILEGMPLDPNDFLIPGENNDRISAVYRNPMFKPSVGYQSAPLTLIMGWRVVEASAPLYILTPVNQIIHEFTESGQELKPTDFIIDELNGAGTLYDVQFIDEPMPLEDYPVGEHTLHLTLNNKPFNVSLIVEDTTAPEAVPVDLDIKIGEDVRPEDFVTDVSDASDDLPILITYYETEPNVFGHDQIIAIKVEDHYGNYTVVHAGLTVQHNRAPPVIEGTDTIIINIGDPILFLQGVTAHDDFGRDLTERILIDNSDVDRNEVGVYTVRYTVVDFTGQSFETSETVHVLDINMELVNEEVDRALARIITEDMTQMDQVYAIFRWVRSNVSYALNRDRPETAYEGAYRAIRERRGNCYVFYSISEIMMTRAGIPNMLIERIPGTPTAHRWNLVNPDGMGWHHYDSFPSRLGVGIQLAFFTDSQATEFTHRIATHAERPAENYYTYDPSLYPEIVP